MTTYLLIFARFGVASFVVEGVAGGRVIVLPFDKVVRYVETTVIVGTVFKVDQDEFGLAGILAQQDVALLHVVVAEYDGVLLLGHD